MTEELNHTRCQRAVGHGFFHTAKISYGDSELRYAYDCGGAKTAERIVDFLDEDDGNESLDVLFVSHFHEDHVRGLDGLLAYVNVGTVVLPYLSHEERLLLTLKSSNSSRATSTYYQFLESPSKWFKNRAVQNVLQYEGWYPDDPRERVDDSPKDPPSPSSEVGSRRRADANNSGSGRPELKLIQHRKGSANNHPKLQIFSQASRQKTPHSDELCWYNGDGLWYFKTFVEHPQKAALKAFYKSICKLLGDEDRKILADRGGNSFWQ